MPHSITPESTLAEDASMPVSQEDAIKTEAETQDIKMEDAPTPPVEEKAKVNLEDIFDDEDSDGEFASSAPVPTSQDEPSQPAPMYANQTTPHETYSY
jgi:DNA primase small subunit